MVRRKRFALALVSAGIASLFAVADSELRPQSDNELAVNFGQAVLVSEAAKPKAVAMDKGAVRSAAIDSEGRLVVYNLRDRKLEGTVAAHSKGDAAIAFSSNGRLIATWGADEKVKLFSVQPLAEVRLIGENAGKPAALAFSGDSTLVAAGAQNGNLTTFDAQRPGQPMASARAHRGRILALVFEPTGKTVLTIGEDERVKYWDARTGQSLGEGNPWKDRPNVKSDFRSASCTPDGSIIAVGVMEIMNTGAYSGIVEMEKIRLMNFAGNSLRITLDARLRNVSDKVAISPDGRLVVSTGRDGSLVVWDVQSRKEPIRIEKVGKASSLIIRQNDRSWWIACAADNFACWPVAGIRPPALAEPDRQNESGELKIEFLNPQEIAPITNKNSARVVVEAKGATGELKWKLRVLGDKPRDLRPVTQDEILRVGPRIEEEVVLTKGANVIEVTASDGTREVKARRIVTYIPGGNADIRSLYSTSHALVIGISKYQKVGSLNFAADDADAVAKVLREKHGFTDITVLKDQDATKAKIMKALTALTDDQRVHREDRVVVFYSGHGQGVPGAVGSVGYFIPQDFPMDFERPNNQSVFVENAIGMSEVRNLANTIPANHVLFLLDCCFSGLAADDRQANPAGAFDLAQLAFLQAKVVITAGADNEKAFEFAQVGHGAFTQHVLNALTTTVADKNGDGILISTEIYEFVRDELRAKNPADKPQNARFAKLALQDGEVVFPLTGAESRAEHSFLDLISGSWSGTAYAKSAKNYRPFQKSLR